MSPSKRDDRNQAMTETRNSDADEAARAAYLWYSCEMPTSEQYRKSAEQCRRVAERTDDKLEREALMRIAAQWERLADHKARQEAERA